MTTPGYDAKAGQSFLCLLRSEATDGYIEARILEESEEKKPPKQRFWFAAPGEEAARVQKHVEDCRHVYVGVAARLPNKGDKQSLLFTNFLWAEMDFKDYQGGEEEARARLAAYDKQPAMIVHSGGGLHLYWRIERCDLTTEANRFLLERALKQFCPDLGADNAATDSTRILRLPGTWNFKAKYGEPRPVVFEHCDPHARVYRLDDFPLSPLPQPKQSRSVTPRPDPPSTISPDDAELLRVIRSGAKAGKIERLMAGDTSDHRANPSAADQALCNHLAYYAGPNGQAQVDRLFRASGLMRDKWDKSHSSDGRTYGQMTIDKAYSAVTNFHDWNRKATRQEAREQSPATVVETQENTIEPEAEAEASNTAEDSDNLASLKQALKQSLAFVSALWDKLDADPGLAFSPEAMQHWTLISHSAEEWARIKSLLRKYRIVTQIEKAIRQAVYEKTKQEFEAEKAAKEQEGAPDEKPLPRVGDVLFDPPLRDLVIPPGYLLRETGIVSGSAEEPETVSYAPCLIIRRLRDIDEGTESLCLAWKRPQGWRDLVVSRAVALNSQQIIGLADQGFPVSSDNARALVKWLHDFEAVNFALLPTQDVTSHLGWQGDANEQGFLWGREYITPGGERLPAEQAGQAPLMFHVSDPGAEQIAEAFHARGTFAGWQAAVTGLERYPFVQIALYASLIPPLLHILQAKNMIVDWSNRTSTGKTTALRVAASVWGCADDSAPDSLIYPWDITRVWLERAASVLHGLPLILDDTKRAKKPEQIAQTLYDAANARGKGRGSLKGTQRTRHWRTVLLSTGEAPATSFTQDGGARTRCIELTGPPFGKDNAETAQVVRALNRSVVEHYGHAGPRFVQWLLQNHAQWGAWAAAHRDNIAAYDSQSGASARVSEHLALFRMVAMLAHDAGIVGWSNVDGISPELAKAILSEAEEASGELRALRIVISWAHSHIHDFIGRETKDVHLNGRLPPVIAGKWEEGEDSPLCFYPTVLKKVLQDEGFDDQAILRGWRDAGYLMTENDDKKRFTKRMTIARETPHCNVLTARAIAEANG